MRTSRKARWRKQKETSGYPKPCGAEALEFASPYGSAKVDSSGMPVGNPTGIRYQMDLLLKCASRAFDPDFALLVALFCKQVFMCSAQLMGSAHGLSSGLSPPVDRELTN